VMTPAVAKPAIAHVARVPSMGTGNRRSYSPARSVQVTIASCTFQEEVVRAQREPCRSVAFPITAGPNTRNPAQARTAPCPEQPRSPKVPLKQDCRRDRRAPRWFPSVTTHFPTGSVAGSISLRSTIYVLPEAHRPELFEPAPGLKRQLVPPRRKEKYRWQLNRMWTPVLERTRISKRKSAPKRARRRCQNIKPMSGWFGKKPSDCARFDWPKRRPTRSVPFSPLACLETNTSKAHIKLTA